MENKLLEVFKIYNQLGVEIPMEIRERLKSKDDELLSISIKNSRSFKEDASNLASFQFLGNFVKNGSVITTRRKQFNSKENRRKSMLEIKETENKLYLMKNKEI